MTLLPATEAPGPAPVREAALIGAISKFFLCVDYWEALLDCYVPIALVSLCELDW